MRLPRKTGKVSPVKLLIKHTNERIAALKVFFTTRYRKSSKPLEYFHHHMENLLNEPLSDQLHLLWQSIDLQGKLMTRKTPGNLLNSAKMKWKISWAHVLNFLTLIPPWCSGYHYCTTSFNKAWIQVLRKLKSCSRRVGYLRWWESLKMFPTRNKAKSISSVNHTTKKFIIIIIIIIIMLPIWSVFDIKFQKKKTFLLISLNKVYLQRPSIWREKSTYGN